MSEKSGFMETLNSIVAIMDITAILLFVIGFIVFIESLQRGNT